MPTPAAADRPRYDFDDRNVPWAKLGELEHFVAVVYDVDLERKIVDFMIKFEPNEQIVLHRHLALTNTLVVQGEHRFYEPDGRLKEVRPCGSYTSTPPGPAHHEGGGPEGCVVFYTMRAEQDALFEILGNDGSVVATLGIADFHAVYEQQRAVQPRPVVPEAGAAAAG